MFAQLLACHATKLLSHCVVVSPCRTRARAEQPTSALLSKSSSCNWLYGPNLTGSFGEERQQQQQRQPIQHRLS